MVHERDIHADTVAAGPPRPIPAAAVVGDLPPARPESQASFAEQGFICLNDGADRWLVRIAGRSLTGRGTSTPIQLALLVFSAIEHDGGDARGDLEALVPVSSIEARWGFDTEGLFSALARAEPGPGLNPEAKGFFAELVPSPRGGRGSGETSGRASRS
jgi:hypothetical protein